MAPRPLSVLLAALLTAAEAAAADAMVERALEALRSDPSLKVRAQAALVLGQHGAREALPALTHALAADRAAAVRIAAASSLARLGDIAAKEALDAASRADPDRSVRTAAAKGLADLLVAATRALALDEPQGTAGDPAARAALKDALARHLRRRGFSVVGPEDEAGYKLKPSVLKLDLIQSGGKLDIEVRASVVAVDSQGRTTAMVVGETKLHASGVAAATARQQLAARALDAAALSLSEDLAAKLR